MSVDLSPKSHVDTPAWQSFEMRMRARAAERRAAKRRRRIRRLKFASAGLLSVALGALSAFAWHEMNGRALLERQLAVQPGVVEWPPLPEPPLLSPAAIQSLPLPADWDASSANERVPTASLSVVSNGSEPASEAPPPTRETTADAETRAAGNPPSEVRPPAAPESAATEPPRRTARQNQSATPTRVSELQDRLAEPVAVRNAADRNAAGSAQQNQAAEGSGGTGRLNLPAAPPARTSSQNPSSEPPVGTSSRNLVSEPPVETINRNLPSEPPVGTSNRNLSPEPAVAVSDPREPVRRTLERYRSAYQRLDASAAHAVWPSVDAGALARAFGALSAQELWFEGCSIDVSGPTADATCKGQSRVVPKIGGGSETARRTWQFKLRQAGDDWMIEKATVK
jgi:hypothetical protein